MPVSEKQAVLFERAYREARDRGLLRVAEEEALKALIERLVGLTTEWMEPASIEVISTTLRGYRISTDAGLLYFPIDPESDVADADDLLLRARVAFGQQGWVPPCYVQRRYIQKLIEDMESVRPDARHAALEDWLRQTYTPDWLAAMFTERYSQVEHVREFAPQIREAIVAFYFGLRQAAVAVLLPVIEGIARGLVRRFDSKAGAAEEVTSKLLSNALAHVAHQFIYRSAYAGYDWVPSDYTTVEFFDRFDERVQLVRSLDLYLQGELYQRIARYSGEGNLNRHAIAHGFIADFGYPFNFHKLMGLLDVLTFATILVTGSCSIFAPEDTDASRAFAGKLVGAALLAPVFSEEEDP